MSGPRYHRSALLLAFCLALFSGACGTNTEEPVFPVFLIFSPVAPPALVSVTAVETQNTGEALQYKFNVSYYVTNSEDGFLGYNLYISSSATAAEAAILGIGGEPYLETGIKPSFSHAGQNPGTAAADLQTQRVRNFRAAPAPIAFQACELYFFTLTAQTRNSLESNPSPQISACAAITPGLCPSGTPCNP